MDADRSFLKSTSLDVERKDTCAQGLVFCVGIDSGILKLYDVRFYDKGPFATFVARLLCCLAL